MNDVTLTTRQKAVYDYLVDTVSKGIPPSVREISRSLSIKSTSTVHKTLGELEEMGLIERDAKNSRSIKLRGMSQGVSVPLVGRITAGVPVLAVEQIEEYLPVSGELGDREDLFALRVVGLSMKNAGILDGDIVIADKSKVAEVGDIVIALIDDEATVKRLGKEQGKPVLYPENEDFSTIYPENLKILGKVVATFRRY